MENSLLALVIFQVLATMELLEIFMHLESLVTTDFSQQEQQGINEITLQSLLNCINNFKILFNVVLQFSQTMSPSYGKSSCSEVVLKSFAQQTI